MAQQLSLAGSIRANMLNQIRDAIDAGSGAGLFRVYSGTRPSTGGAVTTLLAELTFSDPCAPNASGTTGGSATLTFNSITADSSADNTGTATWGRMVDSSGTFVADFNVGTSGADFNLNTTSINAGVQVSCTSASISAGNQ
jgi:hypothetical protein